MDKFHDRNNLYVENVTLLVSDLNKSLSFYTEVLKLKLINVTKTGIYQLGTFKNHILVNLITNDKVIAKDKTTGLYHFAILVPNRKDLALLFKHLVTIKYPILGGSNHDVSEAIYFSDPDGNGIEVYADIDSKTWRWTNGEVKMTTEMLDYQSLFDLVSNETYQKIFDKTIIGHLHLHVANLDKAKHFFVDILGFSHTLDYHEKAVFVSTNNYHHHIGFNIWNGINIANRPSQMVGLVEYQLHVPKDKVKAFLENLTKNDVPFIETKEQYIFDDINNTTITIEKEDM